MTFTQKIKAFFSKVASWFKLNTVPVQEVSAEERVAAALEYQNIASMNDTTTV